MEEVSGYEMIKRSRRCCESQRTWGPGAQNEEWNVSTNLASERPVTSNHLQASLKSALNGVGSKVPPLVLGRERGSEDERIARICPPDPTNKDRVGSKDPPQSVSRIAGQVTGCHIGIFRPLLDTRVKTGHS